MEGSQITSAVAMFAFVAGVFFLIPVGLVLEGLFGSANVWELPVGTHTVRVRDGLFGVRIWLDEVRVKTVRHTPQWWVVTHTGETPSGDRFQVCMSRGDGPVQVWAALGAACDRPEPLTPDPPTDSMVLATRLLASHIARQEPDAGRRATDLADVVREVRTGGEDAGENRAREADAVRWPPRHAHAIERWLVGSMHELYLASSPWPASDLLKAEDRADATIQRVDRLRKAYRTVQRG